MPALTKGKRRLMGDINVVPYIDVMLVLLIVFMITRPAVDPGYPRSTCRRRQPKAIRN